MMSVFEFTDRIPGSFTKINVEAYYACALEICRVEPIPVFAEIGVDQGRSASVIAQAIRETQRTEDARLILVDSWESVLIDNKERVRQRLEPFRVHTAILHMKSALAAEEVEDRSIHMLLIDADHSGDHPGEDCRLWLPKVKPGGIVCCHDYASGFEAVDLAVARWTAGWEDLGNHDGLAIRGKP